MSSADATQFGNGSRSHPTSERSSIWMLASALCSMNNLKSVSDCVRGGRSHTLSVLIDCVLSEKRSVQRREPTSPHVGAGLPDERRELLLLLDHMLPRCSVFAHPTLRFRARHQWQWSGKPAVIYCKHQRFLSGNRA